MSKKERVESISLGDLQINAFVRAGIDENHVLFLGQLIEGGTELPPILITANNEVIDGRHRIQAHDVLGREIIQAKIVEVNSPEEIIAMAFRANMGGSLPPSPQDIEHTISLLVESKKTAQAISELLSLPQEMVSSYVAEVKARLARKKLQDAVRDVIDNDLAPKAAAKKHGVELDKLKAELSGNKQKSKQSSNTLQKKLTFTFKSCGGTVGKAMKTLQLLANEGDISKQEIQEIFDHIEDFLHRFVSNIADKKKRLLGENGVVNITPAKRRGRPPAGTKTES